MCNSSAIIYDSGVTIATAIRPQVCNTAATGSEAMRRGGNITDPSSRCGSLGQDVAERTDKRLQVIAIFAPASFRGAIDRLPDLALALAVRTGRRAS